MFSAFVNTALPISRGRLNKVAICVNKTRSCSSRDLPARLSPRAEIIPRSTACRDLSFLSLSAKCQYDSSPAGTINGNSWLLRFVASRKGSRARYSKAIQTVITELEFHSANSSSKEREEAVSRLSSYKRALITSLLFFFFFIYRRRNVGAIRANPAGTLNRLIIFTRS